MSGEHFSPARVRATRRLSDDVVLLELVPRHGVRPYPAGSHLDVAIELDGLPDTRSYSLVGAAPRDGAYRIAVKRVRESRGGSEWMHRVGLGAELLISAPVSHFEPTPGRPEYLLVAGGIGITPLVGIAERLLHAGRRVRLLYAVHAPGDLVFGAELAALLGDGLHTAVSLAGSRLDLARAFSELQPDAEVLLCGPAGLRDAARELWAASGRPPARLRLETFASGGRRAAQAFGVTVADHGDREITVPANRTLWETLTRAGIEVMSDCRRGECGLCAVTVTGLRGEIDHRDVFLSEAERACGDTLLACVSRIAGEDAHIHIDTGFRDPHAPAATSIEAPLAGAGGAP